MRFAKNIASHRTVSHGGPYSIRGLDSKVVDFSSNVNPLGFPTAVGRALKSAAKTIPKYPDPDAAGLKKGLAGYLRTDAKNLVIGNGATEIIYNFCRATITKSTPVLIAIPTFGEYEAAARLCEGRVSFFRTMSLQDDIDSFVEKIPRKGVVFVCNPNNPTGALVSKSHMASMVSRAKKKGTLVFVDECFIELGPDAGQSLADVATRSDNLFVLRSLTKSFGLAGLRVGYGIGNESMISILNKIKIPWNVGGLAQDAARLALSDKKFLPRTRKIIKKESEFLKSAISEIEGLSCYDSAANFLLVKTKMPSKLLQKKLLDRGILVRDCSTFRGLDSGYIRIAVRTRKENLALIKALRDPR